MTEWRKCRKKPVIVEAMQMNEDFICKTLEGPLKGSVGDYKMRGIKGEEYPCRKDIWEATYDWVERKPVNQEKQALIDLIDTFASEMKARLLHKYTEGYQGWDDPEWSTSSMLLRMMRQLGDEDMVDAGNFLAFLWHRFSNRAENLKQKEKP